MASMMMSSIWMLPAMKGSVGAADWCCWRVTILTYVCQGLGDSCAMFRRHYLSLIA
jgi:hypothetical protein